MITETCQKAIALEFPEASALEYEKNASELPEMSDIPAVQSLDEKKIAQISQQLQSMFEVADEA